MTGTFSTAPRTAFKLIPGASHSGDEQGVMASAPPATVDALLRPYAAAEMECYPVSPAVNNVRNETAECVERVEISAPAPKHNPQLLLF